MNNLKPLMYSLILNERNAQFEFKQATNLTKTDIEVMAFADTYKAFNAYQVRKFYKITNGQHLLKTLDKLTKMKILTIVGVQPKNKSKQYLFNVSGERLLNDYTELLGHILNHLNCPINMKL